MDKSKKKKTSSLGKNLVVAILAILIIGGVFILRTKDKTSTNKTTSEVEYDALIKKDIQNNYPASPKEVIKLYQRITLNLYSEGLVDTQIDNLAGQLRLLLDDDLLNKNTKNEHLVSLKTEISSYKEAKKIIYNYAIKSDSLTEWEKDGTNYCSMISTLGVKEGTVTDIVSQKYVLREDENGKWKVLGFERINEDESKK